MSNPETVSIVIVNYNTSRHIEKLLSSLDNLKLTRLLEIIIVDNSENDIFLNELLIRFNSIKLVKSISNDGFGAACNLGLKHSTREFVTFVNPDIVFVSNVFNELVQFSRTNSRTGFVGGILLNDEGRPTYSFNYFPGYFWESIQALGMGSKMIINKLLASKEVREEKKAFEVDWLIGAFLFAKRSIISELKGFDERFFLYYEDVDIQYRAKKSGFQNYCLPYVKLIHSEKSSVEGGRGDDIYHFYMYKSKMIYYYLHYSFFKRSVLRFLQTVGLYLRMIALFFRKSFPEKKKKWTQYLYMNRYFTGSKNIVFENKRI